MLTTEFAHHFAADWINAWNAHDMNSILAHYTEDFEMSSPYIAQLTNETSGVLQGKKAIANYWRLGLAKFPNLNFSLETTLVGTNSITIIYQGTKGLSAEVFFFNTDLKVYKASAHYQ